MELNFIHIGIYIVNVIILFFFLRWLLYKPVSKFLKKREDFYVDRVKAVEDREKEVSLIKDEYAKLMDDAQEKAASVINKSNEMAKEHSREIIDSAKERAKEILERAMRDIDQEKRLARHEMKSEIAEMAVQIAEKVLQREVSLEDNQKIINDFFDKVG